MNREYDDYESGIWRPMETRLKLRSFHSKQPAAWVMVTRT